MRFKTESFSLWPLSGFSSSVGERTQTDNKSIQPQEHNNKLRRQQWESYFNNFLKEREETTEERTL